MTRNQIRWAAQHDWFIKDNGDGSVTVLELQALGGRVFTVGIISNFKELRDWAGY